MTFLKMQTCSCGQDELSEPADKPMQRAVFGRLIGQSSGSRAIVMQLLDHVSISVQDLAARDGGRLRGTLFGATPRLCPTVAWRRA